jgi:transcription antitermination factor NusG
MREHPWQVLHVISNHEKRVIQHLAARSVEHYLPLYAVRSQWSDRTVGLERPLFPGYIFVRFSPHARISVISTPSVLSVLGDGERETVSCEEIARIREGLASGHILRPHPTIHVGTQVRVRNGVFEGAEGLVTELRGKCKVVITLAAIGKSFSLAADTKDLEVLKAVSMHAVIHATAT